MTIARETLVLVAELAFGPWRLASAQGAPAAPGNPQAVNLPVESDASEPARRRDPFVSLLSRASDVPTSKKSGGLGGLATSEVVLRGVLQSQGSCVALISGPDGKTYSAHVNDRLLDGVIRSVTPQTIVIMQEVNDPLSLVKQREVRKGLRTAEDVK